MNQMERTHDEDNRPMDAAPGTPPAGNLNALRQQAAALRAAADAAIAHVLSGNSQAFNAAMRQEGGQ